MAFSPDRLVADCQRIVSCADDPAAEVAGLLEEALTSRGEVEEAFADAPPGNTTLFSSADLTVQHLAWPPGIGSPPHDHRMWAVVGVYRGEEHNALWKRSDDGLREAGTRVVGAGELLVLDASAIHSVSNPSANVVCGVHVYGGDIDGIDRSEWLPDGTERPRDRERPLYREMWMAARSLAEEHGIAFTPTRQFEAFSAIQQEVDLSRRVLTADEVRQLLLGLWEDDPGRVGYSGS